VRAPLGRDERDAAPAGDVPAEQRAAGERRDHGGRAVRLQAPRQQLRQRRDGRRVPERGVEIEEQPAVVAGLQADVALAGGEHRAEGVGHR
jgi:hypothetical protein